jgi:glucuronate isomerase
VTASARKSQGASRPFIHDGFLLESDVAVDLYEGYARNLPIVDYHAHLPPEQMAADHRFRSITELWLEGDHYKWRAMRTAGVPERCVSGDAPDREKFEAWARSVPDTLRNPLYHWTHMELKRPFGIEELLGPDSAGRIYDRCNERLGEPGFTAMGLLEGFSVTISCTTDDPAASLEPHQKLARRVAPATRVYPTWRPDAAFAVSDPEAWNAWVARLEARAGAEVRDLASLLEVLDARPRAFHALGCRASDHGLETLPAEPWSDSEVAASFDALRAGRRLEPGPAARLQSALVHRLARMDHERGWVQQFHLGALRDVNGRLFSSLGPATGGDSMSDVPQAAALGRFLDRLDREGVLARTILYNLNPADNALMATMAGNFQDGSSPCRMQYGPAWWFLDQLDGMTAQLEALSNMGLLAHFVGMVTDSRSFLSFSRHDYFRRLLCNLLGEDVRRGLVPDDRELLGRLVTRVCYTNALEYFGFEGPVVPERGSD